MQVDLRSLVQFHFTEMGRYQENNIPLSSSYTTFDIKQEFIYHDWSTNQNNGNQL